MIGAISGYSSLSYYNPYLYNRTNGADRAAQTPRTVGVQTARRAASPETPVEPVRPVASVSPQEGKPLNNGMPVIREGADPTEMAVRMRIRYDEPGQEGAQPAALGQEGDKEAKNVSGLPGSDKGAEHIPGLPDARVLGEAEEPADGVNGEEDTAGAEAVQEAAEEGKCQTCAKRKYQDESDDPGVSFQTPTRVGPDQAASAVRGHEMEHVVREQAKAKREDRRVVSQSVTYHTAICPECGKVYVAGGTTRTVTAANPARQDADSEQNEKTPAGFSAVA